MNPPDLRSGSEHSDERWTVLGTPTVGTMKHILYANTNTTFPPYNGVVVAARGISLLRKGECDVVAQARDRSPSGSRRESGCVLLVHRAWLYSEPAESRYRGSS